MDSLLEQTGFELQVPPRTTDCWLAPARHPTGCTEASPLPWRGCGFIGHSAGETLTQSPTWPNHQPHRTAFESDNGRSVLEAGTALHAPNPSLPEATRRAWEGGKRFFAQKPAGMAD